MFDRSLVLTILKQISDALETVEARFADVRAVDDFTKSAVGTEKLDSICMKFMAIGEALKHVDKVTDGDLLSNYPEIDWKGVMGFRDVIAHHYFDIDAEQVFWICDQELKPLAATIRKMEEEVS